MKKKLKRQRRRIKEIIEVGSDLDIQSRVYDYINAGAIIINLVFSILYTFVEVREKYGAWIEIVEGITVAFFAVDYILRILTAGELYDELTEAHALKKICIFFYGYGRFVILFTILSAIFYSRRNSGISYDTNCSNFPFV